MQSTMAAEAGWEWRRVGRASWRMIQPAASAIEPTPGLLGRLSRRECRDGSLIGGAPVMARKFPG